MKYCRPLISLILAGFFSTSIAAESCSIQQFSKAQQGAGAWINQDNWLSPENLRFSAQATQLFMPQLIIKSTIAPAARPSQYRLLDINNTQAQDPLNKQQRSIRFLLDTRLYADGFLVLRNGRIMGEEYWHGLTAQQPRLLLGTGRPLLSLMGAMAITQGKLTADKSVIRYVPALAGQTGLRKLSIQRLLDANTPFEWSLKEISEWQAASGWKPGTNGGDVRAWLSTADRWERDFAGKTNNPDAGPEGDLLAWVLAESYRAPLARVFCENVLSRLRPENPMFWLTDSKGTELSDGLGMSLRDFARFGEMLIEARNNRNRSKIPSWFIETITSSAAGQKTNAPELAALPAGSEIRYGFIHLGAKPTRIAIIGAYGNSLYVDFDQRLVIAIFASYPSNRSANMLATLEQIWNAADLSTRPAAKR